MRRYTVVAMSVSAAALVISCSGGRGADGYAGTSCTVARTGSDVVITCDDGTTETVTDGATGTTGKNGADGEDGATGNDGIDGLNGKTALVALADEPVGANCVAGGTKVTAGLDANVNKLLDDAEVTSIRYVCNGQSGIATGKLSLVNTTAEPAGSNCGTGGLRIDVGLDDDANGTLETSEIDRTSYLCQAGCVVQNSKVTVAASVTGSLDYTNNLAVDANSLQVSHGSTSDFVGWLGFPLAALTSERAVLGIRLYIRHLPQSDSPSGSPAIRAVHGPATAFTRAGLLVTNMPRGNVVSTPVTELALDGWSEIPIDIDSASFAADRASNYLSLGLEASTTAPQSIVFYGADDPATRPYLEIETLRCAL